MTHCSFFGCQEAATHKLRAPVAVDDHGRVTDWKDDGAYCNGHTKIKVIELGNVIVMKLKVTTIITPSKPALAIPFVHGPN